MSPFPSPLRSLPARVALAIVGGAAWSACFSADPRSALACVALAPLAFLGLADGPRPLLCGWIFGLACWLPSIHWLVPTLETFGDLPSALAIFLWALLCSYLALDGLVIVAVGRFTDRRLGAIHLLWVLPATWVLLETQRGFFVHGFPWNLAAYAWIDVPGALPTTAWIGAVGLSFVVVAVNVAPVVAWRLGRVGILVTTWSGAALLVILGGRMAPQTEPVDRMARPVRVIQPNSPITFEQAEILANYDRLLEMSRRACDVPALLVWPESAAWPFTWDDAPRLRRDVAELRRRGCSVLLSTPRRRGDDLLNSAILASPAGGDDELAEYAKRRLVPWGEYVPLAELFPFIGRLARNAGDFTPGTDVALLPWGEERLGTAICYEVIFPGLTAEQVRAGATVLVTVTNDAWYGDTAAPWQHMRAARFRAAENRRPLMRAALTGVSVIVDPRGRVVQQLGVDEEGVLEARLVGSEATAPITRAPWWPRAASFVLLAFAMIRGLKNKP